MKKSCKKSKFTLIEMLAVIAIIGVLLTVVLPGFMKAMKGDVVMRAGRTLSGVLQKARAEAILSREKVYLIFYPTTQPKYIGIMVGDETPAGKEPNAVEWHKLPKEVKLAYASSDDPRLTANEQWNGFSNNNDTFIKWKNNRFSSSDKKGDYLKEDKCKHIKFTKDGKLANSLYFIITDAEINDLETSAKLEINKFTGEVKWLQN